MQRAILIALATAVLSAAVAAGTTIILTGDEELAISSPDVPTQTPSVTTEVTTPSPTGSPSVTATPGPTTSATAAPAPAPTGDDDGPTPNPGTRVASSVNCSTEPKFCADEKGSMKVSGGEVDSFVVADSDTNYSGVPKVNMTTEPRGPDKGRAGVGEEVELIHAQVVIRNDTSRTFVFDKRDIVLEIFRNGRLFDRIATSGEGFEMTPGGRMMGEFDRPIFDDGTYTWQAKTWYRPK